MTILGYRLSKEAIEALQKAQTAYYAEQAFRNYAQHVPQKDRCRVWQAI